LRQFVCGLAFKRVSSKAPCRSRSRGKRGSSLAEDAGKEPRTTTHGRAGQCIFASLSQAHTAQVSAAVVELPADASGEASYRTADRAGDKKISRRIDQADRVAANIGVQVRRRIGALAERIEREPASCDGIVGSI